MLSSKTVSRLVALMCLVLLCSHSALADKCFKKDGDKLKYEGCSEVEVTLQTAAESYEMTIDLDGTLPDKYTEEVVFRFGECEVSGVLGRNNEKKVILTFADDFLFFPIPVVVSKGGVAFTGSGKVGQDRSCTVDFTKIDGGYKSTLKINGEAASKLTFTIADATVFVPSNSLLPAWAWVLIALGLLALILIGTAVAVYFLWWKKRAARKKAPLEAVCVEPRKATLPTATAPKKTDAPPKQSKEDVEPDTIVEREKPSTISAEQLRCIEQPAPAEPKIKKVVAAKPIVAKQTPKPLVRAPIRYDILERTAEEEEALTTTRDDASIAQTIEDDFLNRFPSAPPRFPAKILSKYVGGDKLLRKLLRANQAARRVLIFFKGQSERVYDAATKALAKFGSRRQRDIMADQLAKELAKILQISREVYRFLYGEGEKATLPWTFKSTEEILGLSADELKEAMKTQPPNYKQRCRLSADLDLIKGEIDNRTFHPIEAPILVTLDARITQMRLALVEVIKKEARRDFCTAEDVITFEDDAN